LSEEALAQYPVWVWNEKEDAHCPLSDNEPDPAEHGTLFIKARFRAGDGSEFAGYLIGGSTFYAFGLFAGGGEFVFNRNLPDLADGIDKLLADAVGRRVDLFPLTYESDVKLRGGRSISGTIARFF